MGPATATSLAITGIRSARSSAAAWGVILGLKAGRGRPGPGGQTGGEARIGSAP